MPRKKKLPPIPDYHGLGRNYKNMLVQKSNPLQSLSETGLSLVEFKILDAYLARIDSHKPNERYVRFEKGELEQLLGVTRILKEDLSKRIDNLFQVVTIRDENKPKKFTKIALFSKAECEQDENGQWQIDLACSAEAMEYIFNVENMGYLPYLLKNVIELTSRYSYIMYLYLEKNRFRKSWSVSLDELKALLRCTADRYNEFKHFNAEILKKCHKEVNGKTSMKYSYEVIKKGRKVTDIKFTVATLSDELAAGSKSLALGTLGEDGEFIGQTTLFDEQEQEQDELTALLGKDFDNADIEYIRKIITDNGCDMSLVRTAHAKYMLYKSKGRIKNPKGDLGYLSKILNQLIADTKKANQQKPSYDLEKRRELAATFDPNTISFDDTEGM